MGRAVQKVLDNVSLESFTIFDSASFFTSSSAWIFEAWTGSFGEDISFGNIAQFFLSLVCLVMSLHVISHLLEEEALLVIVENTLIYVNHFVARSL